MVVRRPVEDSGDILFAIRDVALVKIDRFLKSRAVECQGVRLSQWDGIVGKEPSLQHRVDRKRREHVFHNTGIAQPARRARGIHQFLHPAKKTASKTLLVLDARKIRTGRHCQLGV